jgi:hypothetical protein
MRNGNKLRTTAAADAVDALAGSRSNRRVAHALYSMIVAVIVMIAVPVSQLRTIAVQTECCCPDGVKCHCSDHKDVPTGQDSIKECHKKTDVLVSPSSPDCAKPVAIAAASASERIETHEFPLTSPHEPPNPARPPGPS